jgi:nitric oxide synthase oxygenase domain/subunit
MGTEIGARNLADNDRYNLLPLIAGRLGLDPGDERSLWPTGRWSSSTWPCCTPSTPPG